MQDELYTLIVDSREKDNVRKILDSYKVKYKIETLVTGDYMIRTPEGRVTIERKQIGDFIGSLMSGRLENQMRRLADEPCPGLLLTGSFAEYRRFAKGSNFTSDSLIGALASCIVKYGLRFVVWIQSAEDHPHKTGIILTSKLIKKIAEGKLDKIPNRKMKLDITHPQADAVRMMCGIPMDTAIRLINTFGSLRAIMDSSDESLMSVKGMGNTRIARLRMLTGEPRTT